MRIVKILVSVGILALLAALLDLERIVSLAIRADAFYIVFGMALTALLLYINAWKFQILLKHPRVTALKVTRYNMIAALFTMVLPGAVSGDMFRIFYINRDTKDTGQALAAVLIDRMTGIWGQMLLGTLALGFLAGSGGKRTLVLGFGFLLIGLCIFIGFALFPMLLKFGEKFAAWAEAKFGFHLPFNEDSSQLFNVLIQDKQRFWKIVINVFLFNLLLGVLIMVAGKSLNIGLSLAQCLVLLLSYSLAVFIPVSAGNWGISEGVFAVLLPLFGGSSEAGILISLFIRFFQLPSILLGWFYFVKFGFSLGDIVKRITVRQREKSRTLKLDK